jgi:hypothetical protein
LGVTKELPVGGSGKHQMEMEGYGVPCLRTASGALSNLFFPQYANRLMGKIEVRERFLRS